MKQLWYHDAVLFLSSCGLSLKVYGVPIINSYHLCFDEKDQLKRHVK
jgi:hypothetical protein